jgi:hypothetical protein
LEIQDPKGNLQEVNSERGVAWNNMPFTGFEFRHAAYEFTWVPRLLVDDMG